MTKNKSIQLLKLVKIKLMSLALQDRRIKDDAMKMIEKTNSMIREIRIRNTKLDVELLEEITNILGIGIEKEYDRLIRIFR